MADDFPPPDPPPVDHEEASVVTQVFAMDHSRMNQP